MRFARKIIIGCLAAASLLQLAFAQDVEHSQHGSVGATTGSKLAPPTVFFDKSPRVVEYQLKRLDNSRLLQVERKTDNVKYVPVYTAILTRVGMSPQYREEALQALIKLRQSDAATVLLESIGKLDPADANAMRTSQQLASMLLNQPNEALSKQSDVMAASADDQNTIVRAVAFAGLVMAGKPEDVLSRLNVNRDNQIAFLNAIELIPDTAKRSLLREPVVKLLTSSKDDRVIRDAARALGFVAEKRSATFDLLAAAFANPSVRDEVVRTLLKIPASERSKPSSDILAVALVEYAEQTPAEDRTSPAFVDAMQLADQLLGALDSAKAKPLRQRLDAVTVRLVRIKTVEEEMRYDLPYFAVQAGKTVQIMLENHDLMPHNLVITVPGALKEVAQLGLNVGPTGGANGLPYVPDSNKVLHATGLVAADQQTRLTFDAPTEPGEYPYVCTFPQHWYRMYGVMVVVEDLDGWLKNPVPPANPIGSNRSFVQAWTVNELQGELETGLKGRSPEIGKRIFAEASCAGCHKIAGEGGVIGPELTDLITRWKGDRIGVLREILDPSHKVDQKYLMQKVLTADGQTITGILVSEDDDTVSLIASPEAKEPLRLARDEIDAMIPSSISMMPKALMDQYTKDEIFELLAYLESVDPGLKQ